MSVEKKISEPFSTVSRGPWLAKTVEKLMTYLTHHGCLHERFAFAPKGLRLEAHGCRFGYPGKRVIRGFQPQSGCDRVEVLLR
jgi:hypothetical protein